MFIYLIRNLIDGRSYVGQCYRQSLKMRWKAHCKRANSNSHYPLHQAIQEYGEQHFSMEILERAGSRHQLNELEKMYIARYRTFPPSQGFGYNLSEGGVGSPGYRLTEEQRYRVSLALTGRRFTEEHRRKIGLKSAGNKSFLGRKHSEETKQKMRAAALGRTNRSKLGQQLSQETKDKIRLAALLRYRKIA